VLTTSRDLYDVWQSCISRYETFLGESGTQSFITTTAIGAITGASNSLISYSYVYTLSTTVVPTPYTPPQECVRGYLPHFLVLANQKMQKYTGCEIYAPEIRLNYWPTPRVNDTTAAPTMTTPQPIISVVVNGSTLYVSLF
jgi:hypothetical protein